MPYPSSQHGSSSYKNDTEQLPDPMEGLKAKYESDLAQARKHAATLARDKADLQSTVDTMRANASRQGRRSPRFDSPLTPNDPENPDFLTPRDRDEGDTFSTAEGVSTSRRKLDTSALFPADVFGSDLLDSPNPSPMQQPPLASNHPSNEIEALQQRLAHAQRQINILKGTLQKEKQLRMDYHNKLESSPGGTEDEGDDDTVDAKPPKARLTPFRSTAGRGRTRGRGRGRGGMTLVQKLDLAASNPSSDSDGEPIEPDPTIPTPPIPPIPIRFQDHTFDAVNLEAEEQQEEEVTENSYRKTRSSPIPQDISSLRTSIDGMDPAFANVLRGSFIPRSERPPTDSTVQGGENKEENQSLEIALRGLRAELANSQAFTESEHKRLMEILSTSRDAAEQYKNESEQLQVHIEEVKVKNETDLAEAHKHAASLSRSKADLQQTIESLKANMEEIKIKHESDTTQAQLTIDTLEAAIKEMNAGHKTDVIWASDRVANLTREKSDLQQTIDTMKASMKAVMEEMKAKCEEDIAQAREQASQLARDKLDLLQIIDTMKVETARTRIPKFWLRAKIMKRGRKQTSTNQSPTS